jgi:CheY-like chemotaxis protein
MKRKARILLVDDDASLLKLLGLRLRSEGFEVATATSGAEALEWLEQERPDLVLSDLKMDGMDGLALFDRIQRQHVGLPVVIMTAHGSITDAVSATRAGVFGFLTKPIDKEALRRTINEALAVSLPAFDDGWQHDVLTRRCRQGADGAHPAPGQPAPGPSLYGAQLRRADRAAAGVGAVRSRQGGVRGGGVGPCRRPGHRRRRHPAAG